MKIGITQIILGNDTLDDTLKLCADAGYNAVELTFRDGKDLHADMSDAELKTVAKKCADAGVTVASVIATPGKGGNFLSPDPEQLAGGKERVRRSVEIAAVMGVDCTLLHPGHLTGDGTYEGVWNQVRDALQELAPYAEQHGCAVGVENVWNKFLLTGKEMAQFVDEVGNEWVGAYLDTANMMAYGFPEQWIRSLGTRIKKVHFKDFKRSEHRFTNLQDGDTDWKTVMAELRNIGYDDAVIHEVGGKREDHIETARRMREIVAL